MNTKWLVLSHGRGFFWFHVQWLHHIWQCWCCSVGSNLQKWKRSFIWSCPPCANMFLFFANTSFVPNHLWSFSLPSDDHGSRALWLADSCQKPKGFKACRVVQLFNEMFYGLLYIRRKELSYHSPYSRAAETFGSPPHLS